MARGSPGAFGGKEINSLPVWLGFCAVFLRRARRPAAAAVAAQPRPARAALVLGLASGTSTTGSIFTSVPLVYPPLVYLIGRALVDRPARPAADRVAAGLAGLAARRGDRLPGRLPDRAQPERLERDRRRLRGRDRRRSGSSSGQSPYGHFPVEDAASRADRPTVDGRDPRPHPAERALRVGRPRTATPTARSPTWPTCPATAAIGWTGKWDDLRAAHFTSILFDLLAIVGLALVGLRFGGRRLAATLAFAWAAYPFTQYVSSSNTNDAIPPVLLIFGFWLADVAAGARASSRARRLDEVRRAPARARSGPTYPDARRPRTALGLRCRLRSWPRSPSSRSCCSSRTRSTPRASSGTGRSRRRSGATRRSRSGTGASTTPGLPDLHLLQYVLEGLLVARRAGRRVRPAAQVAAAARRAERRAAARLRARADALVLPLHRLVLPVRRLRRPRRRPRSACRRRRPSPWTHRPRAGPGRLTGAAAASRRSLAAVVFAVGVDAAPLRLLRAQPDHRHAGLPALRRRDRRAGRCPTATSRIEYPPAALPVFALPSLIASRGRLAGFVRPRLRLR